MTSQLLAHFYLLELFVLASTDVYLLNPVQGSLSIQLIFSLTVGSRVGGGMWKMPRQLPSNHVHTVGLCLWLHHAPHTLWQLQRNK